MKVKIPLFIIVNVEPIETDPEDGPTTDAVFESAADCLVTEKGLAMPWTQTDRVHVDGFGKCAVTFDLSDLQIAGKPEVLE